MASRDISATGSAAPAPEHGRRVAGLLALLLAVAIPGCGGPTPAPAPGEGRGFVPDLTGSRVMVLPVQQVVGVPGEADAELAFALESRASQVTWIMPPELEQAARSTPGMEMPIRQLPVGMFLRAEVDRIGDPLYGVLRRLAAVTGGEVALIPVLLRYRLPAPDTVGGGEPGDTLDTGTGVARDTLPTGGSGEGGTAEVAAALVSVRTGHVLWFGLVEGTPGPRHDPRVLASALDALGRRLAPGTSYR